jgi:Tol biopolymer transport system component/DNA-binding winged helix-turn-helix (wHTH) protein
MPGAFSVGDWRVDPSLHSVSGAAGEVRLEPKVMQVLVELAEHPGQVVSKDRLLHTVWADTFVGDEVLARAISELRRVFGDDPKAPRFIQTIPKGGYRLIAPVRFADRANQDASVTLDAVSARRSKSPPWTRRLLWGTVGAAVVASIAFALAARLKSTPASSPAPSRTVPFTTYPGLEWSPSFSPDGSRLAFLSGPPGENESRIFVKLIGDDPPQQLTDGPGADLFPAWSPDGRSIAFTRMETERSGLFVMPALGGPARRVADIARQHEWEPCLSQPRWSPDSRQLVFAWRNGQDCRVEVLSLETFDRRVLTSARAPANDAIPAFSPDGQSIAFVRNRHYSLGDIYVVPAHGGSATRLTNHDATIRGQLAWTPDGRFIVFSSDRDGSEALWRVPAAGGPSERLAVGGESATEPAIDSTGRRLACVRVESDLQIYELDPSRPNDAPRAVAPSSRFEGAPQFSPDGRKIAFESARGQGSFFTPDIWVADADGSNPARLTFYDRVHTGTPHWSPDGQWIAFDSQVNGNFDIFLIRPIGGSARRLTVDPANDAVPSWSRDGRWIYFESDRTGSSQIWKMPVEGGRASQITKLGGFGGFESSDGKSFYYSKSQRGSGVWRIPIAGGPEEPVLPDVPQQGYSRCWAIVDDGLYFLDVQNVHRPSVEFFSFATRQRAHVATLPNPVAALGSNLAISPDRSHLLVVLVDQISADIMLVENFQ